MAIKSTGGKVHWNYFLALERDLEITSRYVEFTPQNFGIYSIEFAHLLLAAASEVDVVAKLLCARLAPTAPRGNIEQYRKVLMDAFEPLADIRVQVPRYGLSFAPWETWAKEVHPDWWGSYNAVKHERNARFDRATLQNALNAVGALLILVHWHYHLEFEAVAGGPWELKQTSEQLIPTSTLVRLPDEFYYEQVYT